MPTPRLKARQRLGKYLIDKRLAEGGFAVVYQARDTIEGVRVALKVPHVELMDDDAIEQFRREARLVARLDHPNVLPLKTADVIDGRFVMVTALAEESLGDRLERRLAAKTALDYAQQMLAGLAHAHERSVAHCDVKPDNFLIFKAGNVRLGDFGIARVAQHTLKASGAGTIGYVAPEQAMGSPSLRSDVFSLGLTFYRLFAGTLPEWPYRWPMAGHDRLRRVLHPDAIDVVRRSLEVDPAKRYADATKFQSAFERVRSRALVKKNQTASVGRRRKAKRTLVTTSGWREVRFKEFQRRYKTTLETRLECPQCEGPVSEAMRACPWCGDDRTRLPDETRFPQECPRCRRGMKLDWQYCAWCYGPGFEVSSPREYADKRYTGKCHNKSCDRRLLMPWMRYCPWCHAKVRKKWRLPDTPDKCGSCGWGVAGEFWSCCPWCAAALDPPLGR